ncbi:helix-turn-helix domain-containing protein [Pseudonocardia zijingensis]|uniref:TetR/AcrR family transcriptional regulator n=1 Tax=Pseudonocardia zijingensis TaxID=153376 RepID=A0ABP4A2Y8_9PSEU
MSSSRARTARAERALATRQRVLAAAAPMFVRNGYVETTMADIARAAGVAVQTLYLSFGSKVAVLEATLATGADNQPNGWLADVRAEPSGPAALGRYVEHATTTVERRFPLDAVLRAAAADPEPAELLARTRRAELAAHGQALDELSEKPAFTTEITVQRATEIAAALLSHETYALLVGTQGWPLQDWADWAARHLAIDLFPPAQRG